MKSSIYTRAVAVLASAALLAVSACSAGSSTSSGSSPGGDQNLSIGLVAEPASLDFTTTDGAAIPQALLGNVYETLVKQDDSGKIVPSLAKSWTVSPDRKTYTFDLVDNAKFTNDSQFTADDAVFSINRVKTAWTTSLKAAMDVVTQAKALSPTQLQVTLARPSNDWLFRMTTRVGAMFSQRGDAALATSPLGTGPFKFSKWNRGDSIVMVRNDSYWGSKPFFQQITLKYFKDATALNNALLTGTINVVGSVPIGSVARALTPLSEIIAPIRVVIRNSQSLLGLLSVTCNWVGESAFVSETTSIAAFSEVVQAVFTRLMLNTASDAVKGLSLVNFALSTRSNV